MYELEMYGMGFKTIKTNVKTVNEIMKYLKENRYPIQNETKTKEELKERLDAGFGCEYRYPNHLKSIKINVL